jgi:hypothetical protein
MARRPNYSFECHERDRAKATKLALKADAKREQRERARAEAGGLADGAVAAPESDET